MITNFLIMITHKYFACLLLKSSLMALLVCTGTVLYGQETDSVAASEVAFVKKQKPVKNMFTGIWLIDNQTAFVPVKGTFEMDIMHRFGTIKKGYEDFYGFFAPSNIRLGFDYVPINNLMIGVSITKANMTWEAYGKYALLQQTPGKYPVSVSYLADVSWDTRGRDNFLHWSDRLMYFHQLMIARKITNKLSLQLAPSISHINIVNGYFKTIKTSSTVDDSVKSVLEGELKHQHIAIAFSGRYQFKTSMAVIFNADQPITKHITGNPRPNLSLGIEISTSAHAFQLFLGNYASITPQRNNYFNRNDFTKGEFLIGFNITRLWNY